MEGLLCLPPERNILGRGGWKTRYVKLGPSIQQSAFSSTWSFSQTSIGSGSTSTIGRSDSQSISLRERSGPPPPLPSAPPTATGPPPPESNHVLSIYKQRFDNDPIITFPVDAIASCFLGDVAQKKGFGSISKNTINALQPTLVVHIKPEFTVRNNRRKSHVERLNVYNSEGEAVSKLLFRAGPRDTPSLSAWAKAIQALLPVDHEEGTNEPSGSRGSTSIETVSESGNEDKVSPTQQQHHSSFDSAYTQNSESSSHTSPELRRMTYRAGSPHPSVTPSIDSEARRPTYRAVSPHPSITASLDQESLSGYGNKATSPDNDAFDACSAISEVHATSSTTSSLSRRETILDRAFTMNYIPSTPSPSASPPPNSVARFEALIQEREAAAAESYAYTPDRSVMPASFFDDFVPSTHTVLATQDDSTVPVLRSPGARAYDNRRHTQRPGMSLDELHEALREDDEN